MIDSHSHTFYSKHATGSVDDLVLASIKAGVSILTITDHAPFYIDAENRLLESELAHYFSDIDKAKQSYKGDIEILAGLEFDYTPGSYSYNKKIIDRYPIDFAIGSVHYVDAPKAGRVKVWELSRLADRYFLEQYVDNLRELIESGLFDAIGHADTLLRGVQEDVFLSYLKPLIALISKKDMAFELNASGLRKSRLDYLTGKEVFGEWSYPSKTLFSDLLAHNVSFTMGSDTHHPKDAGAGIIDLIRVLNPLGLKCISYYKERKRIDVDVETIIKPGDSIA